MLWRKFGKGVAVGAKTCGEGWKHGAVLTALLLVSCDKLPGTPLYEAHKQIRSMMNDPDAAKFGEEVASDDGTVVCGTVNGKNAFGAYVGFRPYIFERNVTSMVAQRDPDFEGYFRDRVAFAGESLGRKAIDDLFDSCRVVLEWGRVCPATVKNALADMARKCRLAEGNADDENQLKRELGIP